MGGKPDKQFIVLDMQDVKLLGPEAMQTLNEGCMHVAAQRMKAGRGSMPLYYICDSEAPYANKVKAAIMLGEDVKKKNEGAGLRKGKFLG